jgi:hypothetical protein
MRGLADQVRVMWQNRRCSILFRLLVPGGKWQTLILSPVSAANRAGSSFHSRHRCPLEPPAPQVTSSLEAPG